MGTLPRRRGRSRSRPLGATALSCARGAVAAAVTRRRRQSASARRRPPPGCSHRCGSSGSPRRRAERRPRRRRRARPPVRRRARDWAGERRRRAALRTGCASRIDASIWRCRASPPSRSSAMSSSETGDRLVLESAIEMDLIRGTDSWDPARHDNHREGFHQHHPPPPLRRRSPVPGDARLRRGPHRLERDDRSPPRADRPVRQRRRRRHRRAHGPRARPRDRRARAAVTTSPGSPFRTAA